ncbi:MAG: phage minor head protein [Rickettsiales bacterium]
MRYLSPVVLDSSLYKEREEIIALFLAGLFYTPLILALKSMGYEAIVNSKEDAVIKAILSGSLFLDGNIITGKFNSKISKTLGSLGGAYDRKSKGWLFNNLPSQISFAAAVAEDKKRKANKIITSILDDYNIDYLVDNLPLDDSYQRTLNKIDGKVDKSLNGIDVAVKLSPETKRVIADDYKHNTQLYINNFAKENIASLREVIEKNAFSGKRAKNLERIIVDNYYVTQAKARFLARQETSLLLSKYSEIRYKSAGITSYRWSTSHDSRTRPDHADLDGKIINFNSPPIVDKKTGRRAHAGEDYGCRCVKVPIIH